MAAPDPMQMPPPMGMAPPQEKSMMSLAGGALILVSGVLGIVFWALFITAGTTAAGMLPIMGGSLASIIAICGAIGIIFSLVAVLGGVMGVMRKMWGIALVGGIFGLLAFGYGLGSLLGLVGLILVAVSKKDFQ